MPSLRSQLKEDRSLVAAPSEPDADHILSILTAIQRQFVLDPSRNKIARCTRRSGKTYLIAAYMLYECVKAPRTPVLYAGLTRDSAKEAVWPILLEMIELLDLDCTAQESKLQVIFPNKSKITIFGCDMENARNRLRGRKFKLVCFDETGFYAKLDPLVVAVVPMLADYGGTLCLTSSPGELLQGFFYEADQGKYKEKWSRYSWSIHDNPHFQKPATDSKYKTRAEEELATVLAMQFHGNATLPGYRREWLGEWVSDHTALVYPVGAANLLDAPIKLPLEQYAIGISFSPFVSSVVVAKFSEYSRSFQIVEAKELEDLDLDAFARVVKSAMGFYKTTTVVADTGSYSKEVILELRRRYELPVVYTDQKDKAFHQRIFANDLKAGYIKVTRHLPIVERFGKIVKNAETGDEVDGQENYSPNAALALYRRVYQIHLSSFKPPISEEERHLQQLEQSRVIEEPQWFDRYD